MPKDPLKAIIVLLWLLSGVIIFGWLLMHYATATSFLFAAIFFGLPVLVNFQRNKKKDGTKQEI